jgi:hypothetical protein
MARMETNTTTTTTIYLDRDEPLPPLDYVRVNGETAIVSKIDLQEWSFDVSFCHNPVPDDVWQITVPEDGRPVTMVSF